MSVRIAGKIVSATIDCGVKALQRANNKKSVFGILYHAAQSGNLQSTANQLCKEYPTMQTEIIKLLRSQNSTGFSLAALDRAGAAFKAVREANPVKINKIV